MYKKFETIFVWIIGISEWLGRNYVKLFPPLGLSFALLYAIALEGGTKNATVTFADASAIFLTTLIFTILTELWVIFYLIQKIKDRRPARHYRKETQTYESERTK